MPNEPNGFMVRLLDGPYAGKEIHLKPGVPDPSDKIVVAESQYVAKGVVYCFDLGDRALLEGDQIYTLRNKSELPPEMNHPNLMRGAEYEYVTGVLEDERIKR